MYLTKELTQHSLPEIGANFGGRDHTTVMHAVRKITQERQGNAELKSRDPRARADDQRADKKHPTEPDFLKFFTRYLL